MTDLTSRRGRSILLRVLVMVLMPPAILSVTPAVADTPSGAPGTISTYAGGALGPIANDIFSGPTGIAVVVNTPITNTLREVNETQGTVFFSDTKNHRVKKLVPAPDGSYTPSSGAKIVNVAGSGLAGFGGDLEDDPDGGLAAKSKLSSPVGLALSGSFLYIADSGNNRIRRVDLGCETISACGKITTVVGNGSASVLYSPTDVAVSGSKIYIADTFHDAIQIFDQDTGVLTPISGLHAPRGIAISPTGTVYVSDTEQHVVRRVLENNTTQIVAGIPGTYGCSDGCGVTATATATADKLNTPLGLAISGSSLYIADSGNNRVRKVDLDTGIVATAAQSVPYVFPCLTSANCPAEQDRKLELKGPSYLGIDQSGRLFISDTQADVFTGASPLGAGALRMVSSTVTATLVAGSGFLPGCCADDYLPARLARLKRPGAVAVFATPTMNPTTTMTYIADTGNNRIVAVEEPTGTVVTVAGSECRTNDPDFPGNDGPTQLPRGGKVTLPAFVPGTPYGATVTVDSSGTNRNLDTVDPPAAPNCFTPTGTAREVRVGDYDPPTLTFKAPTDASLNQPWGIAVDSRGNLFIADTYNHRIRRVTSPDGIVDGGIGETITTFAGAGRPAMYSTSSSPMSLGDGGAPTVATLSYPFGIAFMTQTVEFVEFQGGLQLVTTTYSTLFIADTYNDRIRRVEGGTITTTAGGGQCVRSSYSSSLPSSCPLGNGGPPTEASLNRPRGVAPDPQGGLYIADTDNNSIRHVKKLDGMWRIFTEVGATACAVGDRSTCDAGSSGLIANGPRILKPYGVTVVPGQWGPNDYSVFFADSGNHRVREIVGVNTTQPPRWNVAGNGLSGYSGDGGPAEYAQLNFPTAVITAGLRALGHDTGLIADSGNDRIRIVIGPTSLEWGDKTCDGPVKFPEKLPSAEKVLPNLNESRGNVFYQRWIRNPACDPGSI